MEDLSSYFLKSQRKIVNRVVLAFAIAIITGALLLMLPPMTVNGISFIDAFFTSASAICVTGLIVQDTSTFFTVYGKALILILIQMGGLGIMTITSIFALMLGRKINLGDRFYLNTSFGSHRKFSPSRFFLIIASLTIIIEIIGTIILTLLFYFKYAYPLKNAFIHGLFHSISSFNNAGFSIYSNNFASFTGDFVLNITVMILIISGGIGFSVLSEIFALKKTRKLSLHAKLVLSVTGILIFLGTVSFFMLEFRNPGTIGTLNNGEKILASFFQSITPRTAGFNTVNISAVNETTLIMLLILMFIGASPGGTGGGIKTTTFASITLSGIAAIKGRTSITIFKKRIPRGTVYRALTLTLTAILLILAASIAIMIIEKESFIKVVFEATSAFGTVGLSTGITPLLATPSKAILILLMFIGRVGLSLLSLAIASRVSPEKIERPEESISIG
ncbi:MAG: TrkH family potassium uptake protein [Actinomycetota bacterium]|nr:TrkH family potassium uptake protein [Actinomycetota bacterium]